MNRKKIRTAEHSASIRQSRHLLLDKGKRSAPFLMICSVARLYWMRVSAVGNAEAKRARLKPQTLTALSPSILTIFHLSSTVYHTTPSTHQPTLYPTQSTSFASRSFDIHCSSHHTLPHSLSVSTPDSLSWFLAHIGHITIDLLPDR